MGMYHLPRGTATNKYYESDFEYAIGHVRKLLQMTASWRYYRSRCLRVITVVIHVFCCISVICFIIPIIFHTKYLATELSDLFKNIGYITVFSLGVTKSVIFFGQRKHMYMCLEQMYEDWRDADHENRKVMLRYAKMGRKYVTSAAGIMLFSLVTWHIKQMTKTSVIGNQTEFTLTYPGHYITFNAYYAPQYFYIEAQQVVASFFGVFFMVNTFSMVVVVVMHICGQYEILHTTLRSFGERTPSGGIQSSDHIFGDLIKKHNHLLRYSNFVDKTFDGIFISEWLNCVNGACLTGYLFVTDKSLNDKINDIVGMCNISYMFLIFCHIGEQYKQKSENVGSAFYSSQWYNLPTGETQKYVMTIQISQHPHQLTAGKIINLSMETYCDVIKRAFTFMSLLNSVT